MGDIFHKMSDITLTPSAIARLREAGYGDEEVKAIEDEVREVREAALECEAKMSARSAVRRRRLAKAGSAG